MDKLGPYELNQIVTGDARELARGIPDESVDLIYTDPVYWEIPDYEWLGELAARVLKPSGEMLVYYGQYYFYETVMALGKNIKVAWPLSEKKVGGSAWIWAYSLSCEVKPLLWCVKQPDKTLHRIDHQFAIPEGEGNHEWHKGFKKATRWLLHYSHPGAIVLDPFAGGGTIPAVAKMFERSFLGFEIDAFVAQSARDLIDRTPIKPSLFCLQPEQLNLALEEG